MSILDELGPEWIAALALAVQAFIFLLQFLVLGWQGLILRRHAVTLEEHRAIAGAQADALKLIAVATEKQSLVLDRQATLTEEQFKFQRKVEAKEERQTLFDLIMEMQFSVTTLAVNFRNFQQTNLSQEDMAHVDDLYKRLKQSALAFQRSMLMAIHLTKESKQFFLQYGNDVFTIDPTGDKVEDFRRVEAVRVKYENFLATMRMLGLSPEADD